MGANNSLRNQRFSYTLNCLIIAIMSSNYEYILAKIIGKVKSVDNEKNLNEILNRIHGFQEKLALSEINKLRRLVISKITRSDLKILSNKRFKNFRNERLKVIKRVKELNERNKKEKEFDKKREEFAKNSTEILRKENERIDDRELTAKQIEEMQEDYDREKRKIELGTKFYQESAIPSTTWTNKDPLIPPPTEE
jgi:hypothetical protein